MFRRSSLTALVVIALLPACAGEGMHSTAPGPVVVSISPNSGATGVSPTSSVVVTFSQPMMRNMEASVILHESSITGASVAGSATWSADRQTLTFVPAAPLRSASTYVLHLAPTMMSESGARLDHAGCTRLGGATVTGGMMGGGMMGSGWEMNGSYGMSFVFTTA